MIDGRLPVEFGSYGRKATLTRCGRCRRVVVQGCSADFGGYGVECDPEPLDRLGEVLALLACRATFTMRWTGGRLVLDDRGIFTVAKSPPGIGNVDVLVRHDCRFGPDHLTHSETRLLRMAPNVDYDGPPPY